MSLDPGEILKAEQDKALAEHQEVDTEQSEEVKRAPYSALYTKIRPVWKEEDRNSLEQLKATTEQIVYGMFGDMVDTLDEIGRSEKEWGDISTKDLERHLWRLQNLRIVTSQKVSELYLEALLAKHSYDDSWYEVWDTIIEGTQGDRKARADRKTRDEKYMAYFRYYVWMRADAMQKELLATMRIMERTLDSRSRRGM